MSLSDVVSDVAVLALNASTRKKISKKWYNSVADRIPLLDKIKGAGNLMENVDGGVAFNEAAITGDSTACGPYTAQSVLDVSEQEGLNAFVYTPSFQYASVYIDGPTKAINAGEAAQLRIIEGRLKQAKTSLYNTIDKALMGAYGDTINGKTSYTIGLQDIISATPTSTIQGTGIDRSLAINAKTRNQLEDTAVASASAWNTSNAGRQKMTDLYLASSYGPDRPKLCIMTRTVYSAYDISLQANERFIGMSEKQGGGYPKLKFMNDCDVVFSDNCKTDSFYFINPDFLKVKFLTGKNFSMSDFLPAYNMDGARMLITVGFQQTTGAPKYHGVGNGISF